MSDNKATIVGGIICIGMLFSLLFGTMIFIHKEKVLEQQIKLELIKTTIGIPKSLDMRITGYLPTGNKTALMEDVKVGYTAAVSPACAEYFLGSKVYIEGYGVRYINDLTAKWLDEKYTECTLDIAVPTKEMAMSIGNEIKTVIRIDS